MYEYKKLKGRIVEKYGTQRDFAPHVNLSVVSVSQKLNGLKGFSQKDIELWANVLEIPKDDYAAYFFT